MSIRQYLSGTINDPKTQGEQKIQLTTTINSILPKILMKLTLCIVIHTYPKVITLKL